MTLRRRLTLLLGLIAVIPVAVVGILVYNLVTGGREERAFDQLRQTNGFARTVLADRRDHVARVVAARAAAGSVGDLEGDQIESRLRQWMTTEDLDVAVVAEPGGAVLAGVRRTPELAADMVAPTDPELVAGKGGELAILARSSLDGSGRWLLGGVWLDRVRLGRIYRPAGVDLTLASAGRPVASTSVRPSLPDRPLRGDFRARIAGERSFVVAGPVPGSSAILLAVSRPPLEPSPGVLAVLGATFAVLLGLIVLVGHLVTGVVTGPLRGLVDAAEAVSAGDLDRRVAVTGDIEIAALGRAFNSMTESLRGSVRQLEQTRTDFRQTIARLGDALASTDDLPRILEVVLETCVLTLRADKAVFWDRVAMPARLRSTAGFGEVALGGELNGTGIAGTAGLRLEPISLPGAAELADVEPKVETAVAVPLIVDGRLFGVLAVYGRTAGGRFGPGDLETLQTLAGQAQAAIGSLMLHEETRRQARTDDLTGLWNRREFELRGRESVKQAARFEEPFGLMLVDIDDFREVNNRYSYLHGNAALVALAAWLSEATREVDLVARWGGEEFVVLLPRASLVETALVAERVRAAVDRQPMSHDGSVIPLTVSIGYSGFPGDGNTLDQLFNAADAAVKRAKRLGKNRVEQARANEGVR